MIQPDNPTMFVRSDTAFFQIFFNPLLSVSSIFFSVNSPRNFIFSFCALAIISSFFSLMLITEKTGLKIFYNYLKTKIHIFKKSADC